MSKFLATAVFFGSFIQTGVANAEDPTPGFNMNGNADACYEQTLLAAAGADPTTLKIRVCNRALRFRPLSRDDKSAMYHNRGILEQAQGDLAAARNSFERAVYLAREVDKRNIALAQLAYRQGDYDLARQQYDLLLEAGNDRREIVKGREIAARAAAAVLIARSDVTE